MRFGKLAAVGFAGLGIIALGACDDDVAGVVTELEYTGDFQALNSSGVSGAVDIRTDDVQNGFIAVVEAGELDASITHAQHIHAASQCPTMADDANDDGFLDVIEGLPSYGGILIPLDSDLTDQAAGTFPSADASGILDYRGEASFEAVISSIRGEDADMFVELDDGETLLPETRTVVLHGVVASTDLPATVQSLGGLPAQATLPVACAELEIIPEL